MCSGTPSVFFRSFLVKSCLRSSIVFRVLPIVLPWILQPPLVSREFAFSCLWLFVFRLTGTSPLLSKLVFFVCPSRIPPPVWGSSRSGTGILVFTKYGSFFPGGRYWRSEIERTVPNTSTTGTPVPTPCFFFFFSFFCEISLCSYFFLQRAIRFFLSSESQ